ncbi:MAG TPA: DUF488 domain-containing protein [Sphingomicrobium sp.]|nr:DUF488 domain-containing protein [Sphingomicrobium sp.]
MPSKAPFFTIGHSTRTIPQFVELLNLGSVDLVVDVRTVPRSRRNPQYNEDALPAELKTGKVGYLRIADLGGLRPRSANVPHELNGLWKNQSFHNYADYALSTKFAEAFSLLLAIGSEKRCAIMCAEAVWWRCHRRIIADYLIAAGSKVFHIMGENRLDQARLTEGARVEGTKVTYPG